MKTILLALNQDIAEYFKEERFIEEEILALLEENRVRDSKITDNDLRYRFAAARFLSNHVTPELARIAELPNYLS